jgi:hypothetical protein
MVRGSSGWGLNRFPPGREEPFKGSGWAGNELLGRGSHGMWLGGNVGVRYIDCNDMCAW